MAKQPSNKKKYILFITMSVILVGLVGLGIYKLSPLGQEKQSDMEVYQEKLQTFIQDHDYITEGNKNSDVQVVAFIDYRCSHCADYHREYKLSELQSKIDDNQIGYTEIPYSVVDEKSADYAKMLKVLNKRQDESLVSQFSTQAFETSTMDNDPVKTVQRMDLSKQEKSKIIKSYENDKIDNDRKEISNKLRIQSTPTVFVNKHHVNKAKNVKGIVDEQLEKEDE